MGFAQHSYIDFDFQSALAWVESELTQRET
jgi:hypothetical protein